MTWKLQPDILMWLLLHVNELTLKSLSSVHTRNSHNVTCANPLHRACSAPAVLSCMFNTTQEEISGPSHLQPHLMWFLWCSHVFTDTFMLKGPTSFCLDISLSAEQCGKQKAWKAHDSTSTVASVCSALFYVSPSIPRLSCNMVTGAE